MWVSTEKDIYLPELGYTVLIRDANFYPKVYEKLRQHLLLTERFDSKTSVIYGYLPFREEDIP